MLRCFVAHRSCRAAAAAPIQVMTTRTEVRRLLVVTTVVVGEHHRPSHGPTSDWTILLNDALPVIRKQTCERNGTELLVGIVNVFCPAFLSLVGRVKIEMHHYYLARRQLNRQLKPDAVFPV